MPRALLESLVVDAAGRGTFVRIDMEDATCVDDTLTLYRELRASGLDNVGIVLQACLKRTLDDIDDLATSSRRCASARGSTSSRPRSHSRRRRRARRFVACLDALLGGGCRVAIATHDEA